MDNQSPRAIADALANLDLERINVPQGAARLQEVLPTKAKRLEGTHPWFAEVHGAAHNMRHNDC